MTLSRFLALVLILNLPLAGCSGGTPSGTPAVQPSPSSGAGGNSVVISGTLGAQPSLLLSRQRRPLANAVYSSIEVDGTLFTGDAGGYQVTNSTTIPPPKNNKYSASVVFSNIPNGNNEWAILSFYGIASDGSKLAIGQLAGLLNVNGHGTNTATLTNATTDTFQVFFALLSAGALSTYDLTNTAALAQNIAGEITANKGAIDPNTGVFDQSELARLALAIAPTYARTLTISGSPYVALIINYNSKPEVKLQSNIQSTRGMFSAYSSVNVSVTKPTLDTAQVNVPGQPVTPVITALFPIAYPSLPNTVTLSNVYGGDLIASGSTISSPYMGGVVNVPAQPPGGNATVSIPQNNQELDIALNDPFAFAFGLSNPNFATQFVAPAGSPLANTGLGYFSPSYYYPNGLITLPSPFNQQNNVAKFNTYNPFGLPTSDQILCDTVSCQPITGQPPLNVRQSFCDPGTDPQYFNWMPSGVATSIQPVQPSQGSEYEVTTSGPGTAILSSTTASVVTPNQTIEFAVSPSSPGQTVAINAVDTQGHTFTGTANVDPNYGFALINMATVQQIVNTNTIQIEFTVPSAGTYYLAFWYCAAPVIGGYGT